MSITVLQPGVATTIQDLGRYGMRRYGVIVAGAMDRDAARRANVLVGNPEHAAVLETTLLGPTLKFDEDAIIACCGATFQARIDENPCPRECPVFIPRGATLRWGSVVEGCRGYLAIRGGIDVPSVLGSRSTDLRAKLGGYAGRALQAGDRLHAHNRELALPKRTPRLVWPDSAIPKPLALRVLPGAQREWFTSEIIRSFFGGEYRISNASDRMGFRLTGSKLGLPAPRELASEAVWFGTIQVPHDGQPILLCADHPTTGGYPKIAQVISADRSLVAQARPGDAIRFVEVDAFTARRVLIEQEQVFRERAHAIGMTWRDCLKGEP